jgi:hypothetical protein
MLRLLRSAEALELIGHEIDAIGDGVVKGSLSRKAGEVIGHELSQVVNRLHSGSFGFQATEFLPEQFAPDYKSGGGHPLPELAREFPQQITWALFLPAHCHDRAEYRTGCALSRLNGPGPPALPRIGRESAHM